VFTYRLYTAQHAGSEYATTFSVNSSVKSRKTGMYLCIIHNLFTRCKRVRFFKTPYDAESGVNTTAADLRGRAPK
jgi:hypothetical protein